MWWCVRASVCRVGRGVQVAQRRERLACLTCARRRCATTNASSRQLMPYDVRNNNSCKKDDDGDDNALTAMLTTTSSSLSTTTTTETTATQDEASGGGGAALAHIVSTQRDVMSEAYLHELTSELEARRVARQRRLFGDMLVFDGGALSDCVTLDRELIMRDFVQFAMHHRTWGYTPRLFRKYREAMTKDYCAPVPFSALCSQSDFEHYALKMGERTPSFPSMAQLLQPYYGWVMADYLVTTLRSKFDPREPLVVYDVGAGTGALAVAVLDYLAEHFADVYARCEYHVVEQNAHLITPLRNRLIQHYHHVHVHHLSMLNWRHVERRRCVVLALELLDSLPHDCLLWDGDGVCSEQWMHFAQRNSLSTAHERYQAVMDPLVLRYLRYVHWMQEETLHSLRVLCLTDGRVTLDPPPYGGLDRRASDPMHIMASKMWYVHSPFHTAWLPTAQMLLLEVLAQYFPRHHLVAMDNAVVRNGLPGRNAPVLQAKIRMAKNVFARHVGESLCSNAGLVDICFPTNFDDLAVAYRNVCGGEKEVACMAHPEFWRVHGGDKTALFACRTGFNPLLEQFGYLYVFTAHHPAEL